MHGWKWQNILEKTFTSIIPYSRQTKENQTLIGGRTYELMQHGFARDLDFEPITKLDHFHSYVLKSNKYTLTRYPYEFELYNTYRTEENKLTTIYRVVNTGLINLPFGIGGHPAFKIDIQELRKGNYYLEFEEDEEKIHFLYLVDGLVGIDYAKDRIVDKRKILIDLHTFDNDALIMKGITSNKISLKIKQVENITYYGFYRFSLFGNLVKTKCTFYMYRTMVFNSR